MLASATTGVATVYAQAFQKPGAVLWTQMEAD
jgi:hypothetical protein